MIIVNKQLDKFKDNFGDIHIYKLHDAFPHLFDANDDRKNDFHVEFDETDENLLVETTLENDLMFKKKIEQFIRDRKAFIAKEQQRIKELNQKYDRQIRAMDAVLADRGLKEFTKADCCRSMYDDVPEGEKDNKGRVCILPLSYLPFEYRKPEYQLFRIGSGFGCTPSGRGNACYGYFCVNGDEARIEKYDFLGVGNAEVEKIAEELEASWSGGASGCAEKEREPDEPEM